MVSTRLTGMLIAALVVLTMIAGSPRGWAQACPNEICPGDFNCDGQVTINELVTAVNTALDGCTMGISPEQACADLAHANCGKLDQCVVNGTTSRYGGFGVCVQRQTQICMTRLGTPGLGTTPSDLEDCVQQVPSAACSDFDLGDIPECTARPGTLANGAPCAFNGQCQSANCANTLGTNCGVCAAPSQPGDSCATTDCSRGFTCVQSTQQCQPRGTVNASCDADHPCGPDLACVQPSAPAAGTCQAAGAVVGAACDSTRHTAPNCDFNAGLFCGNATHVCTALTFAPAGAQCGSVNQVQVACTNAAACFGAQGQTPGTCRAHAQEGQACDTAAGPSCTPPARCVTGNANTTAGMCALPDPSACT